MTNNYYEGETSKIIASSRVSVKIKDTFYTFEFTEERSFEPFTSYRCTDESRQALWDKVHGEVDKQVQEIVNLTKNG